MALTLVVETGAGLANANSYATVAEADAYHEARLHSDVWSDAAIAGTGVDTTTQPAALVWATRILDEQCNWLGLPYTTTQRLRFPRTGVYSPDGVLLGPAVISPWLKNATAELARMLIASDRPLDAEQLAVLSQSKTRGDSSDSETYAGGSAVHKHALPASVVPMVAFYCAPLRVVRC